MALGRVLGGKSKTIILRCFQAFVDSVDAKEHITEVLDKEQATRAGDGFCAAVSLKDGE
jgi:hypothetical protein